MLAALPAIPAQARPHHGEAWARDRFAAAERMREALNGRPPADRTHRDYQRVINAYRNVYYGAPASTKADPSVVAVAETLVEMGRRFDDDKVLHEAIAQYKFLRREYPGSKYRCDALFTIGEIYSEDLNDPEQARATFQDFLHRYPHNRLVEDARQAIVELDRQTAEKKSEAAQGKRAENESPARADDSSSTAANSPPDQGDSDEAARGKVLAPQEPAPQSERLPRVTSIRHWSTPDYTRVAIDLESGVNFTSQRIAHPDRIYFDLRDTKLASTLVGKSFDVDDGFLKKIRVAQFQPGRTRVVLEVDDLSDYDAFLLPDPYRLIIDIHGKNTLAENSRAKGLNDTLENVRESNLSASAEKSKLQGSAETEIAIDDSSSEIAQSKTAEPSKAESKLQVLRTEAGKAPVTREDVGDDARIVAKTDANASAAGERRNAAVAKRERSVVTKVIVDPDDDDDSSPVEAAKLDVPDQPSFSEGSNKHASDAKSETKSETGKRSTSGRSASRNHHQASARVKQEESASADIEVHEASPTSNGDRSLIRALGLKIGRIVIDPGHGGHDTGTIGPNGLEEKDLVLDVGRRLGKLLETRLGAEVVYTRKDDTFIPLETRTAIANQERADLFISIHANSSHDPEARGVETYYLNFTSSPDALEVAARENAVSEKSIFELQDLVKKIALKEKIEESREFAADVEQSLHSGLAAKNPGIRDRGVKKAPFIVLIGANMPSILAEISFVSNPGDERRLETGEYRQRIAESLYKGIAKYVNGLSGVKVASKIDKVSGQ